MDCFGVVVMSQYARTETDDVDQVVVTWLKSVDARMVLPLCVLPRLVEALEGHTRARRCGRAEKATTYKPRSSFVPWTLFQFSTRGESAVTLVCGCVPHLLCKS